MKICTQLSHYISKDKNILEEVKSVETSTNKIYSNDPFLKKKNIEHAWT